jgi:hypothetical protein
MKSSSLSVPVILVGSSVLLAGCAPLDSLKMGLIEKIPALAMIPGIAPKDSKIGQVAEAGKLSMMIATGQSGKCVITDKNTDAVTEYYVKGKKMKFSTQGVGMMTAPGSAGDDPMPSDVANKKSYFLNDTEYTYMWQEGEKNGIKTKIEAPTEPKDTPAMYTEGEEVEPAPESDEPTMDIAKFEQDLNYSISCDLTELSDSEFVPPTDVTFMDYSQMNEQNYMMYMQNGQAEPGSTGETTPAGKKMPADSMPELDAETQKMIDAYKNQMETAPADQ